MPISLHSHSGQFCLHATGNLEDVVKSAIAQGFLVYGLSEHMPRYRREDLYPEERHLEVVELSRLFSEYIVLAKALQEKYKDRITVLVGMETESIYPELLEVAQELRKTHRLDYIVGSVHHVHATPVDFDEAMLATAENLSGGTEFLFREYFDAQFSMLQQLRPEVVGHFDLIRLFRPEFELSDEVWMRIRRNVDLVVEYGGLFEVNSRAYKKGLKWAYPMKDILKYIQSCRGRFTLSDDSHGPLQVGLYYPEMLAYLVEMGVDTAWYPEPRTLSSTPSSSSQVHTFPSMTSIKISPLPLGFHPDRNSTA